MNVWHIVTSEYPPDVGGVSDYTRQVAEGLARAGDDVHVWCPRPALAPYNGVHVHPELGRIRPADLSHVGDCLDAFPAPRRILVQWVPHGFGYHSMNVWFCLWLARRAMAGDAIELMVHEAYSDFTRGPLRHVVMACVQRLMTMVLMRTASRVWISTPAWEERLRAYALGRQMTFTWLPVPGCVTPDSSTGQRSANAQFANAGGPLIGHFGSFGKGVTTLLDERLPAIMAHPLAPSLLLIGSESDAYRRELVERNPHWSSRIRAAGYLPGPDLAEHIAACDVFIQPYPDGLTSRRTTTMACLSQGCPVVSTQGPSTEPLWADAGAVVLADVTDADGFVAAVCDLLEHPHKRTAVGAAGRALYLERFDVAHIVGALKAA